MCATNLNDGAIAEHLGVGVLYHTVMARIANPDSKRASVRRLERDFGVLVPLEKVYRMMDRLDQAAIAGMRDRASAQNPFAVSRASTWSCSTARRCSSKSTCADTLRAYGYSKDSKHGEVQTAVTRGGLPLGYGSSRATTGRGTVSPDAAHDASRDGAGGDRRRCGHVQQGQPGRSRGAGLPVRCRCPVAQPAAGPDRARSQDLPLPRGSRQRAQGRRVSSRWPPPGGVMECETGPQGRP